MNFKDKDRVRIKDSSAHRSSGELGTVSHVYDVNRNSYRVKLDSGTESGFFESELELLDERREALIDLAETLNKARVQANAIEEMAPQHGVYGDISQVMVEVLCTITGRGEVGDIYDSLLDGNTMREALKAVK